MCLFPKNLRVHVQGLADAFILLGLPFDSPEAIQLNKEIFEAIYYAGLRTSCEIAQKDGTLHTLHLLSTHLSPGIRLLDSDLTEV